MSRILKSMALTVPPIRRLIDDRDNLRKALGTINPGHYYSPIPSMQDVDANRARLFDRSLRELRGIDLNIAGQLDLLQQFAAYYPEQPFPAQPDSRTRYYFENEAFSYADALFLYSMIRYKRPQRMIEIGSGFSSFVMLDTNDLFFDGRIQLTFIEPDDIRLKTRLKDSDKTRTRILPTLLQQVDLSIFEELQSGDILFVDSSHVSKIGSDVNLIFFEVLPRLAKGVTIHFHDVFYPFEYPEEWVRSGRYWNEDYMLRAFLQFNSSFKIRIWDEFLCRFHADRVQSLMPLCLKNIGGSLWLERVA